MCHNRALLLQVTSTQLRDDLLSMLVAGHETTGSALTWTLHLLVQNPETMAKAQVRQATEQKGALTSTLNIWIERICKKAAHMRALNFETLTRY